MYGFWIGLHFTKYLRSFKSSTNHFYIFGKRKDRWKNAVFHLKFSVRVMKILQAKKCPVFYFAYFSVNNEPNNSSYMASFSSILYHYGYISIFSVSLILFDIITDMFYRSENRYCKQFGFFAKQNFQENMFFLQKMSKMLPYSIKFCPKS